MTTAAIYTRVSTKVQATDDRESLPAQERYCRDYAQRQGWDVVRVYVEPGYSATKYDRPVMGELLRDAQAHRFQHVIIDRVNRLSRGGAGHYARYLGELREQGIKLHFANESFDPNTDDGEMLGIFYARGAQKENSERARTRLDTYRRKVRDGHYICGRTPPFGYAWADERDREGRLLKHTLVEDSDAGPVVRDLFARYARGDSLADLQDALAERHIPTQQGGARWDRSVIRDLLKDSQYCGEAYAVIQGERLSYPAGVVPALVSRDVAAACAARMATNRERSVRNTGTAAHALLHTGRALCPHCGHALWAHAQQTGDYTPANPYMQYRCPNGMRGTGTCPGFAASGAQVDALAWQAVRSVLTEPGRIGQLAEAEAERERAGDPTSALAQLQRQVAKARRDTERLYASLKETENPRVRAHILLDIEQLEDAIAANEQDTIKVQAVVDDYERRQRLYNEAERWVSRYRAVIGLLQVDGSGAERAALRKLVEALGVVAHPSKTEAGKLHVEVEVLLFGEAAMPATPVWDSLLDTALADVLQRLEALGKVDPATAITLRTNTILADIFADQNDRAMQTVLGTSLHAPHSLQRAEAEGRVAVRVRIAV